MIRQDSEAVMPDEVPSPSARLFRIVDLDDLMTWASALPPMPASVAQLAALVSSQSYDISDVAEICAYDSTLTVKLIRCANSVAHASSGPVSTAREAILRLGAGEILSLAVVSHTQSIIGSPLPQYGLDEGALWRHSMAAAAATEVMSKYCRRPIPPEAFTAALLHDIGKLVLARFLSQEVLGWLRQAQIAGGLSSFEAEREVLEVHHGEVGGIIAQNWRLPERIVRGITYHHTPHEDTDEIGYVVCLANRVAKAIENNTAGKPAAFTVEADLANHLGLPLNNTNALCAAAAARFAEVSARFNT